MMAYSGFVSSHHHLCAAHQVHHHQVLLLVPRAIRFLAHHARHRRFKVCLARPLCCGRAALPHLNASCRTPCVPWGVDLETLRPTREAKIKETTMLMSL